MEIIPPQYITKSISADNILRESLKELVAGYFGATINYQLNEKFFISR